MRDATGILLAAVTVAALLSSGCGEVEETHFVLENTTDETMYVQDWEWFRLTADGEQVWVTDALCTPKCGSLGGQSICAGARLATVVPLEPGDSVERTWEGTYYEIDESRDCYREHKRGGDLEVEYCYGEDFDDSAVESSGDDGVYEGGWIEDPICERQPFERGDEVRLFIE